MLIDVETVNLETTCQMREKMISAKFGELLANIPQFLSSSAVVGFHRRYENEFRINKCPVDLVSSIITFLSSKGFSAQKVPQKMILFASSLPRDLNEDQVLALLRKALCCNDLEITIWTRNKKECEVNNGCAKLYLPVESFKSAESSFQQTISSGLQFSVRFDNMYPVRVRQWVDKRRESTFSDRRGSQNPNRLPHSSSSSFSSFSSAVKNEKDPQSKTKSFEAHFASFKKEMANNNSIVKELRVELKQNHDSLTILESTIPEMLTQIGTNSRDICAVIDNQNIADGQLKNITAQLQDIHKFLFSQANNNSNNNSHSSTLSNISESTIPSSLISNAKMGEVSEFVIPPRAVNVRPSSAKRLSGIVKNVIPNKSKRIAAKVASKQRAAESFVLSP